jgi:hypothetical protein
MLSYSRITDARCGHSKTTGWISSPLCPYCSLTLVLSSRSKTCAVENMIKSTFLSLLSSGSEYIDIFLNVRLMPVASFPVP